jgi:uncharacterized protein
MKLQIYHFFADSWRQQQRLQREFLHSPQADRIDWPVIWISVTAALTMTLQHYGGAAGRFVYEALVPEAAEGSLMRQVHWAVTQTLLYTSIPWVTIRFVLRQPLSQFGLSFRGIGESLGAVLGMYLVMLPVILWFSGTWQFQQTYPFYRPESGELFWPRMIVWQLLYAVQFVALEFFFRGYLIHGWKRRFGPYAIFAAMIPYCLIHFGKPLPETLGSIVAGVVLGALSLKTNSIWLGAALHIAVAWTMDAAAWRAAM